jgi:hypothetical protein
VRDHELPHVTGISRNGTFSGSASADPAAFERAREGREDEGRFICSGVDNLSSIREMEKSGFHFVGRACLRKIFGFQISLKRDTKHLE